jgi:DNA recombination protein RmuC
VLKDIETKKQVHIIKSELGKLGQEFERFDSRMKKLTDNISQANDNAQKINITSKKITSRFKQIERVQLDDIDEDLLDLDDTLSEKRSSDD